MLQAGARQQLQIVKTVSFGAYFSEGGCWKEEEVLLPYAEQTKKVNDEGRNSLRALRGHIPNKELLNVLLVCSKGRMLKSQSSPLRKAFSIVRASGKETWA